MPKDWRKHIEKRRFTLLLAALSAMILLPILRGHPDDEAAGLLWGVVLVAAVLAAAGKRRVTLIFAGLAVVVFGGRLTALFGDTLQFKDPIEGSGYALTAVFLGMTIWAVFSAVLRAPHINGDTILGAICVYLLIGFLWANLYALTYLVEPGSFSFPAHSEVGAGSAILPEFTFAYYSFVTLTTLGYGDVLPISFRARTLSWVEAVVGVTYMATVIAFLVSQTIVDRQQGREL